MIVLPMRSALKELKLNVVLCTRRKLKVNTPTKHGKRSIIRWGCTLLLCLVAISGQSAMVQALEARDLIERNKLGGAWLSPDARLLLYDLERASLDQNRTESTLWLMDIRELRPFRIEGVNGNGFEWAPDSTGFAYVDRKGSVRFWNIETQNSRALVEPERLTQAFEGEGTVQVAGLNWSPDGLILTLTVNTFGRVDNQPMTGVEVDLDWSMPSDRSVPAVISAQSRATLVSFNLSTGVLARLIPEKFNLVGDIDWSPDSQKIAFSASVEPLNAGPANMTTDIYTVNVSTKQVRALVVQAGRDQSPLWSPDGSRIAFVSQAGTEDWTYETLLGLVAASGARKPVYPMKSKREDPRALNPRLAAWSSDGRELFLTVPTKGVKGLIGVKLEGGEIEDIAVEAGRNYTFASKAKRETIALKGESFNDPPDLYLWSGHTAKLQRLTDLNPKIRKEPFCRVEKITWLSTDGKWQLQGYLLLPTIDLRDKQLPLIVYVSGGPSMASASFEEISVHQYPWPLFLQKGYALFIPNTRGRPGFGHAFHHAMATERSKNRLPATDVISGLNALSTKKRSLDSDRVGLVGWSYGFGVAAYVITTTDRFKAASLGDGTAFLTDQYFAPSWGRSLTRDMHGLGSPFERDQLELLVEESPGHRAQWIKTPCLLEFGIRSNAPREGRNFYHALRYYNVIAEFIVYPRSGHGWTEPRLILDSYRRNLEWFDYWVNGSASERMLNRYGPAKESAPN